MKGCRCYLGAAARANFKFVELSNTIEKCYGTKEITKEEGPNNYVKVCEYYKKNKCYKDEDGNPAMGDITKS